MPPSPESPTWCGSTATVIIFMSLCRDRQTGRDRRARDAFTHARRDGDDRGRRAYNGLRSPARPTLCLLAADLAGSGLRGRLERGLSKLAFCAFPRAVTDRPLVRGSVAASLVVCRP